MKVYAMKENASNCVMFCRGPNDTVGTADLGRGIAMDIVRMQATVTTQIFLCLIDGDHGTMSAIPPIVLRPFGDGGCSVSAPDQRPASWIPEQTPDLDRVSWEEQRTPHAAPAPTPHPAYGYKR